jgi:hypothetical protein
MWIWADSRKQGELLSHLSGLLALEIDILTLLNLESSFTVCLVPAYLLHVFLSTFATTSCSENFLILVF